MAIHSNHDTNIPVATGLAVGIFFVLIFSVFARPIAPSDAHIESLMSSARSLTEVKVFFSEYPRAIQEVDGSGSDSTILYHYQRIYDNGTINEIRMSIGVEPVTNTPDSRAININCAVSYTNSPGAMSSSVIGISPVDILKTTSCAK